MGLIEVKYLIRKRGNWWLPVAVATVSLLLEAGGATVRSALRYERLAIADGEWWRLLSGHLVHIGWPHLLLNLAGLLLVWALVGQVFSPAGWGFVALAGLVAMDAGFWLLKPELAWYVGLSGLLHGLLAGGVAGALINWPALRRESLVLGLMLAAKLAYEAWGGSMPGSADVAGGNVVTDAHLFGALGGFAGGILVALLARASGRIRVPPAASI